MDGRQEAVVKIACIQMEPVVGEKDRNLQKSLEPGSFAFVSVPLGRDGISWNAHRVYGHLRLPMLLEGWEVVDCIGDEHALAGVRDGRLGIDPGRWDAHFPPAKNGPEWVFVLRSC